MKGESESLYEIFLNSHVLVKRQQVRVNYKLMRVKKREFVMEFSQLSFPDRTRTRVE